MYNAMKGESGKEVQLFCSMAHEVVRPNQIGRHHQVLMEMMFLINMLTGSGKSICYALLPWAFDLLRN